MDKPRSRDAFCWAGYHSWNIASRDEGGDILWWCSACGALTNDGIDVFVPRESAARFRTWDTRHYPTTFLYKPSIPIPASSHAFLIAFDRPGQNLIKQQIVDRTPYLSTGCAERYHCSDSRKRRFITELTDQGLIESPRRGHYAITASGWRVRRGMWDGE